VTRHVLRRGRTKCHIEKNRQPQRSIIPFSSSPVTQKLKALGKFGSGGEEDLGPGAGKDLILRHENGSLHRREGRRIPGLNGLLVTAVADH